MIVYSNGTWGFRMLFRIRGSVFPRAAAIALPSALLAVLIHYLTVDWGQHLPGLKSAWAGYNTVLGFLLVLRNNQAYSRFDQGASHIAQLRGLWFKGVSAMFSFCSRDPVKEHEVHHFRFSLVRLASALFCYALQEISDLKDKTLEVISHANMDSASLDFLNSVDDKCEVVVQWIQNLIVKADDAKVIDIAPPILGGALHDFGKGIVTLSDLQTISDIPSPFPYEQTLTVMLFIHSIATPMFVANFIENTVVAALATFLVVVAFWALRYIALEIDQPFGEDRNDLPIREMQKDFNRSLLTLLHEGSQKSPVFTIDGDLLSGSVLTKSDSLLLGRESLGERSFRTNRFEKAGAEEEPAVLSSHA